jgi:phosphoribosylamine--glycine ligase
MQATTNGTLADTEVKWKSGAACCIVEASGGYPLSYKSGYEITGIDEVDNVFVAGADLRDGKLYTHGGRVLGVVEIAPTLKEAIDKAYTSAAKVSFQDMHMRKDIGQRALKALQ